MKRSALVASILVFLFFLFFNGLQVYLIIERVAEAKTKFKAESTGAVMASLSDYHRIKALDTASLAPYAWIAYAKEKMEVSRIDSQRINLSSKSSPVITDTVAPIVMETILNTPVFRTIDLATFDSLFRRSLLSKNIKADYRIDTMLMPGKRIDRQALPVMWERKKRKEYYFATSFMRMPYNSSIFVFAQVKYDKAFIRKDLSWPLLSFGLILLIGNAALLFVYKTIRKQKRINEIKTDFINNMTHEMKTPITIASAGMDALGHHIPANEKNNFYLQTSRKQLRLLNEFVERILDSAVRDVSDFTLIKEKIDLYKLFCEIIKSHAVLKGKPVQFRLAGESPVFILGDRLHLETAFHNIIDNAIKYSQETVNIDIEVIDNGRESIIKIRDNGMGIPPQYTKNVFDKFFRVPQGDAQSIKGFGLGLYYVSSIVKMHGGTIVVHSKLDSGTEFIITLPKNL